MTLNPVCLCLIYMQFQKSFIHESKHNSTTSSTDRQSYDKCAIIENIKRNLYSVKLQYPKWVLFVFKNNIELSSFEAMHRSDESHWTQDKFPSWLSDGLEEELESPSSSTVWTNSATYWLKINVLENDNNLSY